MTTDDALTRRSATPPDAAGRRERAPLSTDVGHTDVVSANVLCSLGRHDARAALDVVLASRPDLVGLQEWGVSRRRLLRAAGYVWVAPLWGGCPVGARTARFEPGGSRIRVLGWWGWADRGARPVPLMPPRVATVARFQDTLTGTTVSVVSFHLTPGVQSRGLYREDRPRLAARHRSEVRRLRRVVQRELALGHVVHAAGDSNFDGLRLPGLTSAWEGREDRPGTLGSHRKIDDVHGPGPAASVTLLTSASDHKAVLVRRRDATVGVASGLLRPGGRPAS